MTEVWLGARPRVASRIVHAALPMPDDLEASIARALFIRDLDAPLRQFWAREAAAMREAPGDAELRDVDERWRKLTREGVLAILHATPDVTKKLLEVVNTFPESERDYAWSLERARLSDPKEQQRLEDKFAEEMLGTDFSSDVGWIARLNQKRNDGDLLERRWRAWNRSEERVRELTLPREPALEQAVLDQPDSVERKLIFAEWLCEQAGGESLGEFIQLTAADARSWKARMLVEYDCAVVGPLVGTRVSLDWKTGFIRAATSWTSEVELLFAHAAAFTTESLELMLDERFTVPSRAPCLKNILLSSAEADDPAIALARARGVAGVRPSRIANRIQEICDTLFGLSKVSPLERIELGAGLGELALRLRQLPWKVEVVFEPDAADDE